FEKTHIHMQVAINNPFDDIGTPPLTRHHILYQHSYLQKRIPSTIVGLVSYTYYVLLILNTQLKKKHMPLHS
ncbi:hypothetical protein ACIXCQ_001893, partial [Staphylococcus aureus]